MNSNLFIRGDCLAEVHYERVDASNIYHSVKYSERPSTCSSVRTIN